MTTTPDQQLREAAQAGALDGVDEALRRGAAVDAPDEWGDSALNLAAEGGHLEVVRLLLEAGAAIEHQGGADKTPLVNAVLAGHADAAELLLSHGARVTRDLLMSLQTKVGILEENAESGMVKPEAARAWRGFYDYLASKWKEQNPAVGKERRTQRRHK